MKSIFEKNMNFFKNNNAKFYNSIINNKSLCRLKIEKVEGDINYLVHKENNRCFLHSSYNKKREFEEMFKNIEKDVDVLLVFGMGCGYVFKYLKDYSHKVEHVIIVEPSVELFNKAIEHVDIEMELKTIKNITVSVGKSPEDSLQDLLPIIRKNMNGIIREVYHISYRSLFEDYYNVFRNKFVMNLKATKANIVTSSILPYIRITNVLKNTVNNAIPVDIFGGMLKNVPAIIVSAGPSLEKNAEFLKGADGKALVIAVGSGIKILDSYGIKAHIRAVLSPDIAENEVFKDLNDYSIPLFFSDNVHFDVLTNYPGPKIRMCMEGDFLSRFVYEKIYSKNPISLSSGFSIANSVFSLLCALGCSKVIFVGQDLCMTQDKMYASGSWADDMITGSTRFGDKYLKTKNIFGEQVFSTDRFISMKLVLENLIKSNPHVECINATEGGLHIENTKEKYLKDVLEELPYTDSINKTIEYYIKDGNNLSEDDYHSKLRDIYSQIEKDIVLIKELNNKRYVALEKLNKIEKNESSQQMILDELREIDKMEAKFGEIEFYKKIVMNELSGIFLSLLHGFYYTGDDVSKKIHSLENSLLGLTTELAIYVNEFTMTLESIKPSIGLVSNEQ